MLLLILILTFMLESTGNIMINDVNTHIAIHIITITVSVLELVAAPFQSPASQNPKP